jgi:hypothetical protein
LKSLGQSSIKGGLNLKEHLVLVGKNSSISQRVAVLRWDGGMSSGYGEYRYGMNGTTSANENGYRDGFSVSPGSFNVPSSSSGNHYLLAWCLATTSGALSALLGCICIYAKGLLNHYYCILCNCSRHLISTSPV